MSYSVEIREVATGETVTREYPYEWVSKSDPPGEEGAGSIYWWTDGNFGCDANRGMEFLRAKGLNPTEFPACNGDRDSAYVVRVTTPDGRVVLDEFA